MLNPKKKRTGCYLAGILAAAAASRTIYWKKEKTIE